MRPRFQLKSSLGLSHKQAFAAAAGRMTRIGACWQATRSETVENKRSVASCRTDTRKTDEAPLWRNTHILRGLRSPDKYFVLDN